MRDCAVQEGRRLAWRIALECVLRGHAEITRGTQVIAGAVEMTRQVGGRLVLAPAEHALHRQPGARMRVRARRRRRVLEHDFLVEPVREAVERTEHAVGELQDPFADDERAATREHLEDRLERELVHVRCVCREPERKLHADDTRRLDCLTLIGSELVEPTRHRAPQARGNRRLERLGRHFEAPSAAVFDDMSLLHEILDGRDQKQRVPARQSAEDR